MRSVPSFSICVTTALAALMLSTTDDAHADEVSSAPAKPVSLTEMSQDITSYYDGESLSAYAILDLSLVEVGAGAVLVNEHFDFARGLGWPLLTLGAIEAVGAVFYAFQVDDESSHFQAILSRDPKAFQQEELAHIQGTTRRFIFYRLTELGLTVVGAGLAVYGFASNRDGWKGLGLGIASIGLPFLIIDTINNGRANRYLDSVTNFDPAFTRVENGPTSMLPQTPWMFSYSGKF